MNKLTWNIMKIKRKFEIFCRMLKDTYAEEVDKMNNVAKLNAIHENDMEKLLDSLGLLDAVNNRLIKCSCCGKTVEVKDIAIVYPENDNIKVCCDDFVCYEKLTGRKVLEV